MNINQMQNLDEIEKVENPNVEGVEYDAEKIANNPDQSIWERFVWFFKDKLDNLFWSEKKEK